MTDMPDASPGSSPTLGEPSAPRDVHLALAGALMAVLFAATLLLVDHRWAPLLRADQSARDGLHYYGINHPGFVQAMQVISASGSAVAWVAILSPVVLSLLWRRLPRLALFVVVAALGSALLNVVVKTVVHRPRPPLSDPGALAHGLSFPAHTPRARQSDMRCCCLSCCRCCQEDGVRARSPLPWSRFWSSVSPGSPWVSTTCPMSRAVISLVRRGLLPWRSRST